jgi:hypothetical protein
MKTLQIELLATALLLALLGSGGAQASPDPSPDNDADVVYLRVNCNENGSPKTNCFESMSAVTTWIWTNRTNDPSPGD